jgi:hypothetical protein
VLSFPEPYALNRSTGVTQGNPLEGTSSTQPSLWPDLQAVSEACSPQEPSRILDSQPRPQHSSLLRELGLKRNMVFTRESARGYEEQDSSVLETNTPRRRSKASLRCTNSCAQQPMSTPQSSTPLPSLPDPPPPPLPPTPSPPSFSALLPQPLPLQRHERQCER